MARSSVAESGQCPRLACSAFKYGLSMRPEIAGCRRRDRRAAGFAGGAGLDEVLNLVVTARVDPGMAHGADLIEAEKFGDEQCGEDPKRQLP